MYSKITVPVLSLLISFACSALHAADAPAVGDAFPTSKATGLEGTFPQTKGKIVLVDFWASWCGPCRLAFPELEKIHKEYTPKGLVLVGVSVDDRSADMQKFLKRQPVSFAIVRDAKKSLVSYMQVKAMPTTYLVDSTGTIRYIHSGYHGQESADALRKQIDLLLEESNS